ncbi:hypothetical protein PCANC_28837 [Puccinia coronata f. sp. avenae]|uniref:Uncharacterized protein n=1 Tax=Puccinia coronata f. sp. avenae TaxID=200324 RepID=A0A2N5THP0_9BASI|nr:hypothetical protein PCANC_28837 [Puccinia coronata f. sp. avenae]
MSMRGMGISYTRTARKPGSDGRIRAAEFESVNDSLGGARPNLNWMPASDINSDAAIQARNNHHTLVTLIICTKAIHTSFLITNHHPSRNIPIA